MKSQVSIEFMIFVTILIAILTVFLWSDTSLSYRMIGIKSNTEAKKLCDSVAFEINSAARTGDGYKRNFYVDETLYGISDFTISIEEYSVYIDWDGKSVSSSIITKNIIGTINKGWNLIENKQGVVYVS